MKSSERALKVKPSSTLALSAKANELKASGIDVINFGIGEPDFNTPEHIGEAAIEAIKSGFTKYTRVAGTVELCKAISKKLKNENNLDYDMSQIVVSNGAKQALFNTFMAILDLGDEVIIPAPFWLSYTEIVQFAGGTPVLVHTKPEDDYNITKEQLEKAYTKKTKAIIINSPCNPSGSVCTKETLEMVADFAVKNDLYVVSDEIYEKLIYDEGVEHISIASLNDEIYKRTITINGVSKSYAMTGWRIGYSASSKELARAIDNIQSHATSNPNSIAQKATETALLSDQQSIKDMWTHFKQRRDYMYERVSNISQFGVVKPKGAFYVFADVSKMLGVTINGHEIKDGGDVASKILEECSVVIIPCEDFGFKNHVRFSYATSMENIKKGMDRIEEFVNKHYPKQ